MQHGSFGAVAFWKLSKRQRTIWGRSSRMVVDYQAYLKCLVKWGTTHFTLQLPPRLLNILQLLLQRNVIQHFNCTWAFCRPVSVSHPVERYIIAGRTQTQQLWLRVTGSTCPQPVTGGVQRPYTLHTVLQATMCCKMKKGPRPQLVDTPHCRVSYPQNRGTVERLLLPVW